MNIDRLGLCDTHCIQTAEAAYAYPKNAMSQLLASRSPVPSSEVQIQGPTWRKVYIECSKRQNQNKLNHDSSPLDASTSIHTQQGDCSTACNGNDLPAYLPNRATLSFRQAASEAVCARCTPSAPARSFAVVYCSSSYWSLMR
jgi:hypothetical protein